MTFLVLYQNTARVLVLISGTRRLEQVPLFNLRGYEHILSVEKHGFEILKVPEDLSALNMRSTHLEEYMQKMSHIVERRLDATFCLVL